MTICVSRSVVCDPCKAFAAKRAGDSHLLVLRANLCRWKRLETPGLWTRIAAFGIAVGRDEAAGLLQYSLVAALA
jgi:hypothetical protein